MQIQVDLLWLSLHNTPSRFEDFLRPILTGRGRGWSKMSSKPFELQDIYTFDATRNSARGTHELCTSYNETESTSNCARTLAAAVDLRKRELADGAQWEIDSSSSRRSLTRKPERLMQVFTNQAMDGIGNLDFFRWLQRLKDTYGASFMFVVVLGYCTQGFRCFPWLAMCYFFKDNLQVDPGTMQFLMSTTMLPMLAKPLYGIISDSIYIQGAHRIPYLSIAAALQVVAWGAIVMHPGVSSSVAVLTGVLTMSNMGAAISEVTNDALVAEAVKSKQGAGQGELQSLAWLALAAGGLLGNLMGGFALQRIDATTMFSIFMMLVGAQLLLCTTTSENSFGFGHPQVSNTGALLPSLPFKARAVLLPPKTKRIYSKFGYTVDDIYNREQTSDVAHVECLNLSQTDGNKPQTLSMQGQLSLLSDVLKKPAVLGPLLWFLSSYAVIPNLGSSMFFYQTQHLGLDSSVIGLVKVVGQAGLLGGSILYNRSLKKVPIRKLFVGIQVLLSLCMVSDIVLVNRVNLQMGVPDEYFVLGASAFIEAIAQFKILPFMVLLSQLCPAGSEGSLLAFFMSAQCLAGLTSAYLGVGLASLLHISANSFEELPLGILIEAGFALLPVMWINIIPEEAEAAATEGSAGQLPDSTSRDTAG